MYRLEHLVSSKVTGINFSTGNYNTITLQAKQGKKNDGGQKIGELCSWSLLSNGAYDVIDDMFSIQSDDIKGKTALNQYLMTEDLTNPSEGVMVEGKNNSQDMLMAYLRAMGINMYSQGEGLIATPLRDQDIIDLCKGKKLNLDLKENSDILHDPSVFGDESNRKKEAVEERRKQFGYIDLNEKFIMPIFLSQAKLLNCIGGFQYDMNGNLKPVIMNTTILNSLIKDSEDLGYYYMDGTCPIFVSAKVLKNNTALREEKMSKLRRGYKALIELIENVDYNVTQQIYDTKMEAALTVKGKGFKSTLTLEEAMSGKFPEIAKKVYAISNKKVMFEKMIKNGVKLSDFIVTKIPVIPVGFRPSNKEDALRMQQNDLDTIYSEIISAVKKLNIAIANKTDVDNKLLLVFNATSKLTASKPTGKIHTNLYTELKNHKSKNSIIRDHTLGKRMDFSGRTAITVNPNLTLYQCGLPLYLALSIYKPFVINLIKNSQERIETECGIKFPSKSIERLYFSIKDNNLGAFINTFGQGKLKEGIEKFDKTKACVKAIIQEYLNDKYVLINREPSLHKFSIQAFKPILVDGYSLEIHPMICAGFNADFDGDTMAIYAMITDKQNENAKKQLTITHNLSNPKVGSLIVDQKQDLIIGPYWGTMLVDNKLPEELTEEEKQPKRAYSELHKLDRDVKEGFIMPQDFVVYYNGKQRYYSTAGRILFNSLLPQGSGFKEDGTLFCDALIRKQELKKINNFVKDNFSKEELIEYLERTKEYGAWYSDNSAVSICITDFNIKVTAEERTKNTEGRIKEITEAYELGLLTKEERKKLSVAEWNKTREDVMKDLKRDLPRNNNLFIMMDSGARGDFNQLLEIVGFVGIVTNTQKEEIEVPVRGNYTKGLGITDYFTNSYTTRKGQVSTALESQTVGYLTREIVLAVEHSTINSDDCGHKPMDLALEYLYDCKGKTLSTKDPHYAFSDNAELTEELMADLTSKGVSKVLCVIDGREVECEITSELTKFFKQYLINRIPGEGQDLKGLNPKVGFMTEETVKDIESKHLTSLKVYNMLGCGDDSCAKCYGAYYDTNELPEPGDRVGFQSAQAIGEPSAQLTLNVFKQGATGGKDTGLKVVEKMVNQTKNPVTEVLALDDGTVEDMVIRHTRVFFNIKDHEYILDKDVCIVKPGQQVKKGDVLSTGSKDYTNKETIKGLEVAQMEMIKDYCGIYEASKLGVMPRHFEVLVKAQTGFAEIINPKRSNFTRLDVVPLRQVLDYNEDKLECDKVVYRMKVLGKHQAIMKSDRLLSAICEEDFKEVICEFSITGATDAGDSTLGRLLVGSSIRTGDNPYDFNRTEIVVEDIEDNFELEVDIDDQQEDTEITFLEIELESDKTEDDFMDFDFGTSDVTNLFDEIENPFEDTEVDEEEESYDGISNFFD